MNKNKLRNGLLVAAAVGAGAAAYTETRPSVQDRVAKAQAQIMREAKHNAAYPPNSNTDNGAGEYNAARTAEDTKGIGEAKKLTARRIAKLNFIQAFNEATDVGAMVIDVSDMTSIPAQEVLGATLPKSSVEALAKRKIHFIYDSAECNPIIEGESSNQVGYIPLSVSDTPSTPKITTSHFSNSGADKHGSVMFVQVTAAHGEHFYYVEPGK